MISNDLVAINFLQPSHICSAGEHCRPPKYFTCYRYTNQHKEMLMPARDPGFNFLQQSKLRDLVFDLIVVVLGRLAGGPLLHQGLRP